jgi:hypothetical protein
MKVDCSECKGTGSIKRRPVDGGDYDCPECDASGKFSFTLVSRKTFPSSKRRSPHVVVGDCIYQLDKPMREGAQALIDRVPYNCNPYREDTNRSGQWNYGHELASVNPKLASAMVERFSAEEIW